MKKLICFIFLLTSTLLISCTTTPSNEDKVATTLEKMELEKGDVKDRILNYRIRSWKYVDRKHIILEVRRKQYYLISLPTPCIGLSNAMEIGFSSFGSSLSQIDKIIVKESATGITRRCTIKEITGLIPVQTKNDQKTENKDNKK